MINLTKVYITRDIFLLLSLWIFPVLSKYVSVLGIFDEFVFLFMLSLIAKRVVLKKSRKYLFPIALIAYLLYSFYLIKVNGIPIRNVMQIFITSKFLIIFFYYHMNSDEYKSKLFVALYYLILTIFFSSVLISLGQLALPDIFNGYSNDGRGLRGAVALGVFGSRTLFPEFLIVTLVVFLSVNFNNNFIFKNIQRWKALLVIICLITLFLTFSRKDLLIGAIVVSFLMKDRFNKYDKIAYYLIAIVASFLVVGLVLVLFKDANQSAFSEKYIRFIILLHALDVSSFYFPLGSGPGTFGTIMSLEYQDVYEKFNVGKNVLGWREGERGPIFDLFLFSLMAEYGLGLIFFFYFFYKMVRAKVNSKLAAKVNVSSAQIILGIFLFITLFLVPITLNWVGFLIFTILGLISRRRYG